jgi:hypothetical protein
MPGVAGFVTVVFSAKRLKGGRVMAKGVTPWLRQYSDLIAAVGALVVFTSWAVSNTLGQRYAREATSITEADDDRAFFESVAGLRQSQERLISISRELRSDLRAAHTIADGLADRFPILTDYYRIQGFAAQVRELRFEYDRQVAYAKAIGTSSDAVASVDKVLTPLEHGLAERQAAIDTQLQSATANRDRLKADVADFATYFGREVGPQLGPLFRLVANAKNVSYAEGRKRLQSVKRRADRTSTIALVLYALGSILVLGGKFAESKP